MNFQSKPKWSPSVRNAKMHGAAPKIYHLLMKLIMISTENFQEKKHFLYFEYHFQSIKNLNRSCRVAR